MGEKKRRQQAAEADPGFEDYRARLKEDFPNMPEREIGEGWMRQYAGDVSFGKPLAPEESITLHLCLTGETGLTAAFHPSDVERMIAAWERVGQRPEAGVQGGWTPESTQFAIVQGLLTNQHTDELGCHTLACAALWLIRHGENTPEQCREFREPTTIFYFVTPYGDGGYRFTAAIGPPSSNGEELAKAIAAGDLDRVKAFEFAEKRVQ